MYDGLSNGLSASLFIGWMHMSEKDKGHFYTGLDLTNGFTQNRRSYNYNVDGPITKPRNDFLMGLKIRLDHTNQQTNQSRILLQLMLYTFGIWIYELVIRLASLWNPKAKAFINGRKESFNNLPKGAIWMHCASLGEFEQGRPLIEYQE